MANAYCYYAGRDVTPTAGAEHCPGDWLATFALDSLGVDEAHGAYLTSIYWGFLTMGRLIGVGTSIIFTPGQLIAGHFGLSAVGVLILVSAKTLGMAYFAASVTGLGLSILYPMGIVLAQTRLPLTEAWTSRFLAGGAIGAVMVRASHLFAALRSCVLAFLRSCVLYGMRACDACGAVRVCAVAPLQTPTSVRIADQVVLGAVL